jgi:hypothetical protein
MSWSMPRPVLHVVAAVIGVAALGSFAVGIFTADAPARLPGERPTEAGQAIQAAEAVPLAQERIEGPPPPPELTPEEKARLEEEKKAKAEAEAAAKAEAEKDAQPPPAAAPAPPPDRIGEVLDKAQPPPPPEEPVF